MKENIKYLHIKLKWLFPIISQTPFLHSTSMLPSYLHGDRHVRHGLGGASVLAQGLCLGDPALHLLQDLPLLQPEVPLDHLQEGEGRGL